MSEGRRALRPSLDGTGQFTTPPRLSEISLDGVLARWHNVIMPEALSNPCQISPNNQIQLVQGCPRILASPQHRIPARLLMENFPFEASGGSSGKRGAAPVLCLDLHADAPPRPALPTTRNVMSPFHLEFSQVIP